jgi:hypothetical protein
MAEKKDRRDFREDFPTPPWATRALCEHVLIPEYQRTGWAEDLTGLTCWEPAANRGHMVKPLREYFGSVHASDVFDYGAGFEVADFLMHDTGTVGEHAWIITNPPFRLAAQFAARASLMANDGFALLTRIAFLEGVDRYKTLFHENPPSIIAQFTERVPMVKGRYDPDASTATAYCWLVWRRKDVGDTRFMWIPPCRRQLLRPEDTKAL